MQTINLDISRGAGMPQPTLQAKQGDVGRKFKAVITDNGLPYAIPAGTRVTLWYSGTSGEGNYAYIGSKSAASISDNTITVELIAQMLTSSGGGTLCLVLTTKSGEQLGLWNIHYWVEAVPGGDSAAAKSYYTAFSEAMKAAQSLPLPVESTEFPGCYYRLVDGVTEWINPPLHPNNGEFRTVRRYGNEPVYAKTLSFGALPNKALAFYKTGVPARKIVDMQGWTMKKDNSYKYPLPMVSGETVHVYMLANDSGNLTFRTMADYSEWTACVTLWYVK